MTTPSPVDGRLMWVELMTPDVEAAKDFYAKVVGWTITAFDGPFGPYAMWTRSDGGSIGGVTALDPKHQAEGMAAHWLMYVGASKLEDAVARAEALGGKAVTPVIDMPNVGRVRIMRDSQGAMFAFYEPVAPPTEPEDEPQPGAVSWLELMTTDAAAALQFYQHLFGWQNTGNMELGPMGTYRMFGRHLGSMGGMMNKPPEMVNVPSTWGLYFLVSDVPAALGRVTAHGGTVLNGPMEVPGGDTVANCMDPQGAAFSLHARKRA
jgi:predicted enzyme related to lactoylglutathione lyase